MMISHKPFKFQGLEGDATDETINRSVEAVMT